MKKELSLQDIINLHIGSDRIIDSASMIGDYKTNNKEFKKRDKLFRLLEKDLDMAKEVYKHLLGHDGITTKISASSECLKLGLYISEAEQILEEMSKRKDIGTRRLSAEMVLRVWRGEFPGKTL
jgi:hypothetical protein